MRDWIQKNREVFERDVLRDFCRACLLLKEQIHRFSRNGTVSFSVLKSMIGEPLNKGLLWRLKDKAHHIFLHAGPCGPAAPLLDWTLGYLFHESLKLMEDAHQRQYYAPFLADRMAQETDAELAEVLRELQIIQGETRESIRREVGRLDRLLLLSRRLFCLYFSGRAAHQPLARFLNDNNTVARGAFEQDYALLITSVYGREPERMHIEAARSLLESARADAAAAAIEEALTHNPLSEEALALRERCFGTDLCRS